MEDKRRKGVEEIRKDGERMMEGGRRKGRRDIVEMKDGAIEDNINCLFEYCSKATSTKLCFQNSLKILGFNFSFLFSCRKNNFKTFRYKLKKLLGLSCLTKTLVKIFDKI